MDLNEQNTAVEFSSNRLKVSITGNDNRKLTIRVERGTYLNDLLGQLRTIIPTKHLNK